MPYKITFVNDLTETVEAESYQDNGKWIDFVNLGGILGEQVLRVRADEVRRIDKV